jgi:hypothetical protein
MTAPEELTLTLTAPTLRYLDALLATGLFGVTRADCAERLIADNLSHRMGGPLSNTLREVMDRR